jgi:hypothetical protein
MQTTAHISPPDASDASTQRTPLPVAELDPLISVIPVAGPPAVLLVGPLVLFGLLLAGPFVLILTIAAVLAAAAALVAIVGVVLASPYLLVRHLRARHAAAPATISRPVRSRISMHPRRAAA